MALTEKALDCKPQAHQDVRPRPPPAVRNGNRGHVNHLARAGSGSCCGRKKRAVSQQVMAAARKISNSSPSPDFAKQARIADQMSKQQHEVQQAEG